MPLTLRGSRVRVALLATCASLALAVPARAQYFGQNKVQYDRFDFKVLATPHFDIHYYPAEADAAQAVGRMAERWYARLSRVFGHQLSTRQPVVLYASHPEFEQTNVVEGMIDEATGGVTEGAKRRVVLPLAASLGETDHVLGHELVHAFQYDILGVNAGSAPLWFIEGMAEYFSLGPRNAQTAMWIRDAAIEDKLPAVKDLDNPRYFPYRFGHAFWAYIGGRWGDAAIGQLVNEVSAPDQGVIAGGIDAIGAIEALTGEKQDKLSDEWHRAIRAQYDVAAAPTEKHQIEGTLNVGPSLSPDGSRIAFLSERGRFAVDLYVADAKTGKVLKKLTKSGVDPHFESLQFLASAGSWDPSGQRLAVATVRGGKPVIALFDVEKGDIAEEIPLDFHGEVFQPTWSPDGKTLAFSAQVGGVTDLYLYDTASKQTKQLTKDTFADLQPTWSADGRSLAFVTDRYSSDMASLAFGSYQLARLDVGSGQIAKLDTGLTGNIVNPQFAHNGASILFISDTNGRPEVYRMDAGGGNVVRLTTEVTGVAGITPLSPALSVASGNDRAAITVFRESGYQTEYIDSIAAPGLPIAQTARVDMAMLPPSTRTGSIIAEQLAAPKAGLPDATTTYEEKPYSPKFQLVDVSQQVGVAASSTFGTYVAGGISLLFSDVLGNHLLNTAFDVNGGVRDIAAQATYINRVRRWNWGVFGGRIPYLSGSVNAGNAIVNNQVVYVEQTDLFRETASQVGGLIAYPLSRATRLEVSSSYNHIGFTEEVRTQIFDPVSGVLLDDNRQDVGSVPSLTYGDVGAALVRDTAANGPVGPVLGERFRFEVAPTFGDLQMTNVSLDYRRYVMPFKPVTLAGRLVHIGRYGSGGEDTRLTPLFLGYPSLVRGWDVNSFEAGECSPTSDGSCPEFDRLLGSRILVANLEARAPLVGLFKGQMTYGAVPIEVFAFLDSGVAWTRDTKPSGLTSNGTRDWVQSAGGGARVNAFGFAIVELNLARALNRPQKGWQFIFNLRPSF